MSEFKPIPKLKSVELIDLDSIMDLDHFCFELDDKAPEDAQEVKTKIDALIRRIGYKPSWEEFLELADKDFDLAGSLQQATCCGFNLNFGRH